MFFNFRYIIPFWSAASFPLNRLIHSLWFCHISHIILLRFDQIGPNCTRMHKWSMPSVWTLLLLNDALHLHTRINTQPFTYVLIAHTQHAEHLASSHSMHAHSLTYQPTRSTSPAHCTRRNPQRPAASETTACRLQRDPDWLSSLLYSTCSWLLIQASRRKHLYTRCLQPPLAQPLQPPVHRA